MRCDSVPVYVSVVSLLFQSLLGFLMRCDIPHRLDHRVRHSGFQSLLGFLMRCDKLICLQK